MTGAPAGKTEASSLRANGALRILIVDDCAEDRELYRRLLNGEDQRGYVFAEAGTSEDGLALVEKQKPDCILLDYVLPDHDGLDFLAALRGFSGEVPVPVVMLTGQDRPKLSLAARKTGALAFVEKGAVTGRRLAEAIQWAVEAFESEHAARS